MPSLDKLCEAVTADNTDAGFRLWMTSMPSTAFPPNVLQVWKGGVEEGGGLCDGETFSCPATFLAKPLPRLSLPRTLSR